MAYVVVIQVLVMLLLAMVEATPPGIANNPSHSRCLIKKYKMCYNLEHVCPKFCPESCTVECVSCKPICSAGGSTPAPPDDSGSPPPPSVTPSPPIVTPSPPIVTPSPPPPVDSDSPPPPSLSSPPPPSITPSPPTITPSPLTTTPPPSPPKTTTPTPSSPSVATPSPPTTTTPSPSPSVATPSPPTTATPSPPIVTPSSPTITPSPPTTTPTPSTPTPKTTPSPPTTTPSPSLPSGEEAASETRVRCKNKNYPSCYNTEHVCPNACPGGCEVNCVSCKPVCNCDQPGAVCQDPRFIGGDGITFYFHGKKDRDFCLVSDSNLHINAHFIGKRNQNMKRDFTWVQSIGILFNKHRLFIAAQNTSTWDNSIDRLSLTFDDQPIPLPQSIGATWQSKNTMSTPRVSITRLDQDTNNVLIKVDKNLVIKAKVVPITQHESNVHNYDITKDDCFAHLELGFKFLSLSDRVDGVLGQTYAREYMSRVNVGISMPVMGGESKFESSSMFATDCSVSKFVGNQRELPSNGVLELPSLSCASSMDGKGVVCKR